MASITQLSISVTASTNTDYGAWLFSLDSTKAFQITEVGNNNVIGLYRVNGPSTGVTTYYNVGVTSIGVASGVMTNGRTYTISWVTMGTSGSAGTSGSSGSSGSSGRNGTNGTNGTSGASVVINNNTDNYLITATGTANTVQGELNAQFNGTTMTLTKDSTSPNISMTDSVGTGDPFVRFIPASTSNSVALGVDNTDQIFKISYGTSAVLGTNDRFRIATTGNISIPNSLQVGSSSAPTYPLDVSSGTRVTNAISARIDNDSDEGVLFYPHVGASGGNGNSVSGDTAMVSTAGENLVVGAGGQNAGFRFAAGTTTTVGNLHLINGSQTLGYGTGAGGSVTQLTSKATGVTLNRPTGIITMNNATLNATTTVSFTLTNSVISATDIVVLQHTSVGSSASYNINAFPGAGSAVISVRNITTGNLSEAIVIRFAVIESVST